MLIVKVEEFVEKLEIKYFKVFVCWFENFKFWKGIFFKRVCGEEKLVDILLDNVIDIFWIEKLFNIL